MRTLAGFVSGTLFVGLVGILSLPASAQIYNWDTGEVIAGTEGITPGPGLTLTSANLQYADFSGSLNLNGSDFQLSILDHARFNLADMTYSSFRFASLIESDFSNSDLSNVTLENADLTDANFTDANICKANFSRVTGFTEEQLASTANYQAKHLQEINFTGNNLMGWNLADMNLSNAKFGGRSRGSGGSATMSEVNLRSSILTDVDFEAVNMARADMQDADVAGGNMRDVDLTDASLRGTNLTGVDFNETILSGADFTNALIAGASFYNTTDTGLTQAQFYATASYQTGELKRFSISTADLSGWDFSGFNLEKASLIVSDLSNADLSQANLFDADFRFTRFENTDLSGANLISADFRGASVVSGDFSRTDTRGTLDIEYGGAITENAILNDGHIAGLNLGVFETLFVRDYDGGIAITIEDGMTLDPAAVLEIVFTDADWGSTISLVDGIPVDLDGTLFLGFADGADVNALVGTTYDVFNWNGQLTAGDAFANVAWPTGFDWDISDLYLGGTVTLTAVPEPASVILLSLVLLAFRRR